MNNSRGITNSTYRRRIRQIIVLIFTILMGVLISQATQAHARGDVGSAVETGN